MLPLSTEDCHAGPIYALDGEMAAVEAMSDKEHETATIQEKQDLNAYFMGRLHAHNVVIACLPAGVDGLAAAATLAKDMSRTFHQLRFGLLVGTRGGVPEFERGIDIRLLDIVVSEPSGSTGGVAQYDEDKCNGDGEWEHKITLEAPPTVLITALQKAQSSVPEKP